MAARRRAYTGEETVEHTIPGWGIFAMTLCVVLIIGFGWATYKHGAEWLEALQNKFYDMTGSMGLRLGQTDILGNHQLPTDAVLEKIDAQSGTPILAIDIHNLQRKLADISLVRDVSVSRLWPDRLIVQIQERTPIALWQKDQKLSPIDKDGVNLSMLHSQDFADLPVVVGEGAPQQTSSLLNAIAQYPDLKAAFHGATYVSGRRWDLFLKSGMQIKLPEGDIDAGVQRFMQFANEHEILSKPVAVVDLRLDDRVVIKPIATVVNLTTTKTEKAEKPSSAPSEHKDF